MMGLDGSQVPFNSMVVHAAHDVLVIPGELPGGGHHQGNTAAWSPPPFFWEMPSEQADRNALSAVAALMAAGTTPAWSLPREKVPGAGCGPGKQSWWTVFALYMSWIWYCRCGDLSRWHTKVQVKAMQKNMSGKDPQQWDIWRKTGFAGGPWDFHAITLRNWRSGEKAALEAGGDWTDGTKLEWEATSQCASGKVAREGTGEEWGRGTGKGRANGSHKEL